MPAISVVRRQSGELIEVGPNRIRVVEDGANTDNRLGAVVLQLPPNTPDVPPHFHRMHDETFLVTKGKVRFSSGSNSADLETGDYVVVGSIGVTMIDNRDVAEIAALELLRREQASDPLPTEMIELVGPESLTGESIARLWSDVLGESVTYTGDDLQAVERAFREIMPAASAYDIGLVFRGILDEGVLGEPGAADRLAEMLRRPLRTYRAFAEELVAAR